MPSTNQDPGATTNEHGAARAVIRRDILRANTAVAVVLLAVLALALAAIVADLRAMRNERRAINAEASARERLASAYLEQARTMRVAAQPGRRTAALNAITNAAAIHPSTGLRTEAIACLALAVLRQKAPLLPTPNDVHCVGVASDLELFVCGDAHGRVSLFSPKSAGRSLTLEPDGARAGKHDPVVDLSISPNKQWLAARHSDGAVIIWDLQRRLPVETPENFALTEVAFSPDSREVVFSDGGEQGRVSVFDIDTKLKKRSPVVAGIRMFRMKPDMSQIALGFGPRVDILHFPSGSNCVSLTNAAVVTALAWTPDGRSLGVACVDGAVYLWDLTLGTYRIFAGQTEKGIALGFSPDGKWLFSSSRDGTTHVWNVTLGELAAVGEGLACYFADSQQLGFWRAWDGFGIWQISPSPVYSLRACDVSKGPLMSLELSPSGKWCVATQNEGFHVWDLTDGKDAYFSAPGVLCARTAFDEKSLYVCRQSGLEQWPLAANAAAVTVGEVKSIHLPDGAIARSLALSTNDRTAAVELRDRRLMVVDLAGKELAVSIKDRWSNDHF